MQAKSKEKCVFEMDRERQTDTQTYKETDTQTFRDKGIQVNNKIKGKSE